MEIKNYTSFWSLERKVYSFYDVQLPIPLSLRVLAVFVGTGIPWWLVVALLQVPFGPPWYLVYVIPPGVLAWVSNKPIFEGKTLFEYLKTRAGHLLENRSYKRLEPDLNKYEEDLEIEQNVITKEPLHPSPFK
jgi:hypothetical protein